MPFFEDVWRKSEESRADGESRGFRIPGKAIVLWVAPSANRCCLIDLDGDSPDRDERVSTALYISTPRLVVEGSRRRYIGIECRDPDLYRIFDYLIRDLGNAGPLTPAVVDTILSDYRKFWSRPNSPLSDREAAGLFGEVWFLARWLHEDLENGLCAWIGSAGTLHDFVWSDVSVEVKTSLTGVPATHRVGSLEQLQQQDGRQLLLFSLALRQDLGAGTYLEDLIDEMRRMLPDHLAPYFMDQVAGRGFRPDDQNNRRFRYVLVDGWEHLYEVRDGFPRLIGESLVGGRRPDGVGSVKYEICLGGFDSFRSPLRPGFRSSDRFGSSAALDR
jgi:hypothetical protein